MKKHLLALLILSPILLSACAEKEFAKGLNNVWTSGAGNVSNAPVFSAESGSNTPAQKKKLQADADQPR